MTAMTTLSILSRSVLLVIGLWFGLLSSAFAEEFRLSSPSVREGQQLSLDHVFQGAGCGGKNLPPELSWSNAPEDTKSFAVTFYDPDAPTESGWWHWFVLNIPAHVNKISPQDKMPEGAIELNNDSGAKGFSGACPPPGRVHRYQFKVYALPAMLPIDENASNALASFMVNASSIAESSITAVYNR